MKTTAEAQPVLRSGIVVSLLLMTLACAGCQTFNTQEEFEAQMAREHGTWTFFQPGWYGTWKP